jgi:hypothetical protein
VTRPIVSASTAETVCGQFDKLFSFVTYNYKRIDWGAKVSFRGAGKTTYIVSASFCFYLAS